MNKKRLVVAISGPSNSGKTTTIVKLSNTLIKQGFKVCVVKHDPKDKAVFDTVGKDSYKFSQAGADVAVVSPTRTTVFKQECSSIENLIDVFDDFDYLIVEGLKILDLPRISIFRNSLENSYFPFSNAIATDDSIKKSDIPSSIDRLDLNDIDEIISWINKNSKRV
ncbi:MAG: molybdopterin-guanine dinucleotide biosynthesis protein B [Campylobacterota bacterium]